MLYPVFLRHFCHTPPLGFLLIFMTVPPSGCFQVCLTNEDLRFRVVEHWAPKDSAPPPPLPRGSPMI